MKIATVRGFFIETKSLNHRNWKLFREISEANRKRSEREDGDVDFDQKFGYFSSCPSRYLKETLIDLFLQEGDLKKSDEYNLSQSFVDVPKKSIGMTSYMRIFLKNTSKLVENFYGDNAVFNMSYEEFMGLSLTHGKKI